MNSADLIVIAVVAAIVLWAVSAIRRNQKSGKSPCGCRCPDCGGACGKKPRRG